MAPEFDRLMEYFYFVDYDDGFTLLECKYKKKLLSLNSDDGYFLAEKYINRYRWKNSIRNFEFHLSYFEILYW